MTPFIITMLIACYFVSTLLFLVMTYIFKKMIDVQSIFIAFIPVINTYSLLSGILGAMVYWYTENKNKVLIEGRPNKTKKKTPKPLPKKSEIPIPKD